MLTLAYTSLEIVTQSNPAAFPSALRQKRTALQTALPGQAEEGATIRERCPQCGREEMTFHTLQLRSADEGAGTGERAHANT